MARIPNPLRDPYWLIPRLCIVDKRAVVRPLYPLYPEQHLIIDALIQHPNVCILKPRQMGASTAVLAWMFQYALKCQDPINLLSTSHERKSLKRFNRMYATFAQRLPPQLRPRFSPESTEELVMRHNGAAHRTMLAGGKSQGRSDTVQIAHFSETAFYTRNSAATKGAETDEDLVASIDAAQHEGPHTKTIFESTADGPGGVFHKVCLLAQRSPEWAFLFFRWFDFPYYSRELPDGWEPTAEELDYQARFKVSDEQLAWMRYKRVEKGLSAMRFRREYPSTPEDPFLPNEEGAWFDVETLQRVFAKLAMDDLGPGLRVWHEYEPGRVYFGGMDTSGGTGGDDAAISIRRDDGEQVCRWSSTVTSPYGQAEVLSQISRRYGNAMVCVERNKYGDAVIKRAQELGVPIWTDSNGKHFWMQGGPHSSTKKTVFAHARRQVADQWSCSAGLDTPPRTNCPVTVQQYISMSEDDKGNIAAPEGQHDDLCVADVLALWCGRHYYVTEQEPEDPEVVKYENFRAMMGGRR